MRARRPQILKHLFVCCFAFAMLIPTQYLWADIDTSVTHYVVENYRKRTSSLIKSGKITVHVDPTRRNDDKIAIDVGFEIEAIIGALSGKKSIDVEHYYLTPEFLEQLRKERLVETDAFTAEHIGYQKHTLNGVVYSGCDVIEITHINLKLNNILTQILTGVFGAPSSTGSPWTDDFELPKNTKIRIRSHKDIPGLHWLTIDGQGTKYGMNIKIGLNYVESFDNDG